MVVGRLKDRPGRIVENEVTNGKGVIYFRDVKKYKPKCVLASSDNSKTNPGAVV